MIRMMMAILCCKTAAFVGRLIGKGSSMPGKLALRICPDLLVRLKLPETVIAVSGSNGKTSTVEMIVQILQASGKQVCWNREGSNQTEGVTTTLVRNADLRGRVRGDAVVLESDEQYARYTFRHLKPTHFAVLNLLRDQMTRNGHPEYILSKLQEAVDTANRLPGEMTLILNGDDPLCATLAGNNPVIWFGSDAPRGPAAPAAMYDDGLFCPVCGGHMTYRNRTYATFGTFECEACDFSRPTLDHAITFADPETGEITVDGAVNLHTELKTWYNFYNMLAAYTVALAAGADSASAAMAIDDYVFRNGRVRSWILGEKRLVLLTAKHENTTGYDQALELAARRGGDVLILVDAISRKYFTGETSWLWDINFDLLNTPNIRRIFLAGQYGYDLENRFSYTGVPGDKIYRLDSLSQIAEALGSENDVYMITCFADRAKLLANLPKNAEERSENL